MEKGGRHGRRISCTLPAGIDREQAYFLFLAIGAPMSVFPLMPKKRERGKSMTQDLTTLHFQTILNRLADCAVSGAAKRKLAEICPILSEDIAVSRMEETTAARRVLDAAGAPPLALMDGLDESVSQAAQGAMLSPEQLTGVARFAASARALARYLRAAEGVSAGIASYRAEIPDFSPLENDIVRAVREDAVLDDASSVLRDLRRARERAEREIREKLNQVLVRHKNLLADAYVTLRGGCYVVPVQRKMQGLFPGKAIDASARGGTVFMEPNAIGEMKREMDALDVEIDAEERRILYSLSDETAANEAELRRAMRAMVDVDALFAKAKLSAAMRANPVVLTGERVIRLINARHPLLNPDECVPINFELSAPRVGVAVTGPNTGGKTVSLQTVGLLCAMAQSGLHVPCDPGSVVALTDAVYCDMGDSQSISQNLSTFSGHMTNVIRILESCSRDSLVLLDEPGSGTDPAEGSALAMAILEELTRRKCFFIITTHDPQIKLWSERTENVVSARMAFDKSTLMPLYRLEIGVSGESCAIEIAKRLGLGEGLLSRARAIVDFGPEAPVEESSDRVPVPASRLRRSERRTEGEVAAFCVGDSVSLLPDGRNAIVFKPADREGNVVIQLPEGKKTVRYNRLKLLVPASELYPPDYDFSIIFDTVANRKAAHSMNRKFDPDSVIVHREGKREN